MRSLTSRIKGDLWRMFGSPDTPAEWDGRHGGGKLSQRFWEYFQCVEMLDLTPDSVVLDVGGGSPDTGIGFFAQLLAPHVRQVHIMDTNVKYDPGRPNVSVHRALADRDNLAATLTAHPEIDRVVSVSVFEHIVPSTRVGIIAAINAHFRGDIFVATLEYHSQQVHFEQQLTARSLSELFEPMTRFHLEAMAQSPVHAENAFGSPALATKVLRRLGIKSRLTAPVQSSLWYPLALKFVRADDADSALS